MSPIWAVPAAAVLIALVMLGVALSRAVTAARGAARAVQELGDLTPELRRLGQEQKGLTERLRARRRR